jgi:hypothetical protein
LILIVTFVVLAAMAMLTQKRAAHSATSAVTLPPAPTVESTALIDKTFDHVMHKGMQTLQAYLNN